MPSLQNTAATRHTTPADRTEAHGAIEVRIATQDPHDKEAWVLAMAGTLAGHTVSPTVELPSLSP